MDSDKPTLAETVAALKLKVDDEFSGWAIDGALRALADNENPLRLNFFSTGMRILFEHLMDTLSPEGEVVKASWFTPERNDGNPPACAGSAHVPSIQEEADRRPKDDDPIVGMELPVL